MKQIFKIIRYTKELRGYYLAIGFLVLISSLLSLAVPFLTKLAVDQIVARTTGQAADPVKIGILLVLMLVASTMATFIANINGHLGDMMGVKLNTLLSRRYYEQLMSLPIGYYDTEMTGKITARLERSIASISQLMQNLANNFFSFALTTIFTLIAISIYSWPVALMLAVIFPAYIWITQLSSRAWQKRQKDINHNLDLANGRFIESISQIRVIKSFVTEKMELAFFAKKRQKIENQTKKQSQEWHKYDVYRRLVLGVIFFLIYSFIIWQTWLGHYTIGTLTLLLQLANQAQFPLFGSSFIIDALQRAAADSKDYFEIMAKESTIIDRPDARRLKASRGAVEYKDVNFAYDGSKQVLNKISFKVAPGSKVALVGESGEGKTTLTNLLLRFYEPTDGAILVDGADIKAVSQESLRDSIGVVFQEPALFSGTVKENIAYGQSRVSNQAVVEAAKAANALGFIDKLPSGFDTQIGERGVRLSGGQKQRLAIARAILKNAPILILDEATSSLDSKAEREVQSALERLMKGRTTLIIAHRLSTIAGVDMVVGLKDGQIAEIGTPAQLARGNGIYAELLRLQSAPLTKRTKAKLREYDIG